MVMFATSMKVLVATLVLAATSLSFAANAAPRPNQGGWQGGWQGGESYMRERHDPTNTNGS
jgi:Spy/CpxP family protein refolding chaperone